MLGMQALVNMAVAMAILPPQGLTLPFNSYGGSSLLVTAAAVGILHNISRSRQVEQQPDYIPIEDETPEVSATVMASAQEGSG
jgi:cell division protein FtsW